MKKAAWKLKLATKADRKRLEQFKCASSGAAWDIEVEHYINQRLLNWATADEARHEDRRLLLLIDRASNELVGVVGHVLKDIRAGGKDRVATLLMAIAVASAWQNRSFSSGERVSSVLGSAAMQDIASRRPPRDRWVLAKVHEDNEKALKLCARFGLTHVLKQSAHPYKWLISERSPKK